MTGGGERNKYRNTGTGTGAKKTYRKKLKKSTGGAKKMTPPLEKKIAFRQGRTHAGRQGTQIVQTSNKKLLYLYI